MLRSLKTTAHFLNCNLGNTRVTYSVEVVGTNNISYTTESAMDYFPYDEQVVRSKNDSVNHFNAVNREAGGLATQFWQGTLFEYAA